MKTSSELQLITLSGIINHDDLTGLIIDDIKQKYFSDVSYQFIVKLVFNYYRSYSKCPTYYELLSLVDSNYNESYGDINDLKNTIYLVYSMQAPDYNYVKDQIELFIKRSRFEEILVKSLDRYNTRSDFTVDEVYNEIVESYEYSIIDDKVVRFGDYSSYLDCRRELLGTTSSPNILKSFIPTINSKLTYKGYRYGELVVVVAPPATGKTAFMINEMANFAKQGYNVLALYIGDMNNVTVNDRLMALFTGMPISTFANSPENYGRVVEQDPALQSLGIFDRIYTQSYAPEEISASKLLVLVDKLQRRLKIHFDAIIIDYADNLESESDSMYTNGGKIYNKLKTLAVRNRSVVITGSQPKISKYGDEVISFDGIAESSKKLHVVDIMITLNKPSRQANIATGFMPKVREGETGGLFRVGLRFDKSTITEIDESEYSRLKAALYEDVNQLNKDGLLE